MISRWSRWPSRRQGPTPARSAALEVVFVLEKARYDRLEAPRSLELQVENTNDFALLLSGASLTPEQRMAALDDVEAVIASRPGTDFDADTQALVAFLQTRPEFTAVGASDDGTIGALFADGTLVFIVHSAPADEGSGKAVGYPSTTPTPLHAVLDAPAPERIASSSSAGIGTVPTSPRFRLLNGVGSFFDIAEDQINEAWIHADLPDWTQHVGTPPPAIAVAV